MCRDYLRSSQKSSHRSFVFWAINIYRTFQNAISKTISGKSFASSPTSKVILFLFCREYHIFIRTIFVCYIFGYFEWFFVKKLKQAPNKFLKGCECYLIWCLHPKNIPKCLISSIYIHYTPLYMRTDFQFAFIENNQGFRDP